MRSVDVIHGHKIADPYRWLEDANSPDYTELCAGGDGLHPQPARSAAGTRAIHERLTQLLVDRDHRNAADWRANITSTRAARGRRTSRCCSCAKDCTARIASLVDVNQTPAMGPSRWTGGSLRRRQVCGLRDLGQRLREQHAARDRDRHRQAAARHALSAPASPSSPGRKTIPVSITDAIPRKATCPRATTSTICTFSYHPLGTDPDNRSADLGRRARPEEIWPRSSPTTTIAGCC